MSDGKTYPVAGPWITDREITYVAQAAETNWYGNAGDFVSRFETAFATFSGRRSCLSLPSCTSGLHLALAALGIGPGDEVVVPDVTWIATAAAARQTGAAVVFADIDPHRWTLSAETVAPLLTERTKAVIAVDLYGQMPDYDPLLALLEARGVPLIEDAAEAHGALYRGRPAGSFGLASTFSFHGTKTLTTGEGGALTADDPDFVARCRVLSDHGRRPDDRSFRHQECAFKYKMSSVQAALGLAQVERADEIIGRKKDQFSWYEEALAGYGGVTLNPRSPDVDSGYWMVTALWDAGLGIDKADLIGALAAKGVTTRPFFYPLSDLPAFHDDPQAAQARRRNLHAYDLSRRGINLPSALSLTKEDIAAVSTIFMETVERLRGDR